MEYRTLGRTGLEVSALGFGAWEIGWTHPDDGADVGRLLNRALDLGINFVDSSAAYRWSEELIGKYLGHRRDDFFFVTKCGSWRVQRDDGEWVQTLDYSGDAIQPAIDRSLRRLRTDHIDLIQLHSPPVEDVESGSGLEGLKRAQAAGKVRFIGISADGDAARVAIRSGEYDTLQITYNVLEQEPAEDILPAARAQGMGIIVKNPIANAVYEAPRTEETARLWDWAAQLLAPEVTGDRPRVETALRWLLSDGKVDTAIVGTTNLRHLEENVAAAERGALPEATLAEIRRRWEGRNG